MKRAYKDKDSQIIIISKGYKKMKSLFKEILKPLYQYIKNKNRREFIRLLDKYGSYKRYTRVNNVRFLKYSFDVPDLASFIWQFKDIFVDEIYKFHSESEEPIIFDCGANIGTSCLYFKSLYPKAKIIAFEADPTLGEVLKTNLQRNGMNDVEIINKAVWTSYDRLEFGCDGADGGSVYLAKNKMFVETIRLKDYLEKEPRIDFLKIDIEGAEYEVLKDCSKSLDNVKYIFIEYHSWNNRDQKLSEILAILENNRFRYYLDNIAPRKYPFINYGKEQNMDLQINIFGVKENG